MNMSLQVFCLLTSMFENRIAVLEIDVAALLRSQQNKIFFSGTEKHLSVFVRYKIISLWLNYFSFICVSTKVPPKLQIYI